MLGPDSEGPLPVFKTNSFLIKVIKSNLIVYFAMFLSASESALNQFSIYSITLYHFRYENPEQNFTILTATAVKKGHRHQTSIPTQLTVSHLTGNMAYPASQEESSDEGPPSPPARESSTPSTASSPASSADDEDDEPPAVPTER